MEVGRVRVDQWGCHWRGQGAKRCWRTHLVFLAPCGGGRRSWQLSPRRGWRGGLPRTRTKWRGRGRPEGAAHRGRAGMGPAWSRPGGPTLLASAGERPARVSLEGSAHPSRAGRSPARASSEGSARPSSAGRSPARASSGGSARPSSAGRSPARASSEGSARPSSAGRSPAWGRLEGSARPGCAGCRPARRGAVAPLPGAGGDPARRTRRGTGPAGAARRRPRPGRWQGGWAVRVLGLGVAEGWQGTRAQAAPCAPPPFPRRRARRASWPAACRVCPRCRPSSPLTALRRAAQRRARTWGSAASGQRGVRKPPWPRPTRTAAG